MTSQNNNLFGSSVDKTGFPSEGGVDSKAPLNTYLWVELSLT